jgi:hypothetical protein
VGRSKKRKSSENSHQLAEGRAKAEPTPARGRNGSKPFCIIHKDQRGHTIRECLTISAAQSTDIS